MAFDGFSKNSGPSARPGVPTPFGNFPRAPSPPPSFPGGRSSVDYSDLDAPRSNVSPLLAAPRSSPVRGPPPSFPGMLKTTSPPLRWGDTNATSFRNYDNQGSQRPPELLPLAVPSNPKTSSLARTAGVGRASHADLPYSNKNFSVPSQVRSPPLQNNVYAGAQRPHSYGQHHADIPYSNRNFSVPSQVRSPPLQNNVYAGAQRPHSYGQQRPFSSPVWANQEMMNSNYSTPPVQGGMASITTNVGGANQSGRMFPNSRVDVPVQKRTRSPTFTSDNRTSPESTISPSDDRRRSPIDYSDLDAPETVPWDSAFDRSSTGRDSRLYTTAQKPSPSSPIWNRSQQSRSNNSPPIQDATFLSLRAGGIHTSERGLETKHADSLLPKRTRSPTPPYKNGAIPDHPVFSSDYHGRALDPQIHKQPFMSGQTRSTGAASAEPTHSPPVKKTKLPLASSSLGENLDPTLEIERELDAKAKRLARFKEGPIQSVNSNGQPKKQQQSISDKQRLPENPAVDANGGFSGGRVLQEGEDMESSGIITGLCSDMCPESERAERERKGDLDQYERLDGDRNLSSEFLAVKKYTRTAEREAELIRPLPILQKTMGYLLDLLDKPYDDRFLGLYNFLWDRMRAIRMDLRMQHIFNLEAISMLEQMIRLHIIAMHELCEYTKGEGFSEGFDAHLNIEQMNKASVELFQFYDDHRKNGIHVSSEREFRGYYALLKLDKHPGYKVEPAELSLDLAKMSPEMRQTAEVLFARDVARACRTGNFIAFFRLARKASYLQACLMHAHFSKLRTQALASLHSGLQNNQGIPIDHIAKWLGMEEEDIENLADYHGFSVKDFKEPYMMKENAFINVDNDFPVKRSKLVEKKRSSMIVCDVSSSSIAEGHVIEEVSKPRPNSEFESRPPKIQSIFSVTATIPNDVEMDDPGTILSPKVDIQKPHEEASVDQLKPGGQITVHDVHVTSPRPLVLDFAKVSSESNQSRVESVQKPKFNPVLRNSFGRTINSGLDMAPSITLEKAEDERSAVPLVDSPVDNLVPQPVSVENVEDADIVSVEEDNVDEPSEMDYYEEVAEAKLKLILRIWKRRTAKKREVRERRLLAADAALSSLSLGPPIWQNEIQSGHHGIFSIDDVMSDRHEIQERSQAVLNPSDVIATKLMEKNPDTKCLCWKMILCSQDETPRNDMVLQHEAFRSDAISWLHSKLIPSKDVGSHNLLVSSRGLAIWRTWIPGQSYDDFTSCLAVIKSSRYEDLNTEIGGASAVLFLLSESTPLELQKNRLHSLVSLLPSGSRLPLLILSGSAKDELNLSSIAKDLGLEEIDKLRVAAFHIIYLKDQMTRKLDGFFSSERLRGGLEWLASETPPQIGIYEVKTRELVLSHLNSTMDALDKHDRISPNNCVTAFNGVLDRSIKEVACAAHANPTSWPCHEIELLEKSSDEYRATAGYLPSIGWSSHARIEAALSALTGSKLPPFMDELAWLSRGAHTSDDIENQKSLLERCLISYLTDTSQMMDGALAQREANIMLQKCTQLELHYTAFYLKPNWLAIFRRIFNWRIMNLTREEISSVYVLEQQHPSTKDSEVVLNSELEDSKFLPPYIAQPSFDELVEVSYNPDEFGPVDMDSEAVQPWSLVASDSIDVSVSNGNGFLLENKEPTYQNGPLAAAEVNGTYSRSMHATEASKGATERLRAMLKKCNVVQDMIDKKLSIYF